MCTINLHTLMNVEHYSGVERAIRREVDRKDGHENHYQAVELPSNARATRSMLARARLIVAGVRIIHAGAHPNLTSID